MNKFILTAEVQQYIDTHLDVDVATLAMAKSPFATVTAKELAVQIAAKKKCLKKLPLWFSSPYIYYPPLISVEQCSSETTAAYKAQLAIGTALIDLTGGFGVDSCYFAKAGKQVTHCEINAELSALAAHNAATLGLKNISFYAGNGLDFLKETSLKFDTIYVDPARRSDAGKVFMLKDCLPNVVEEMELLKTKSSRIIIKTSPLLDISAGLKELKNVSEVHIVSLKNECKELLFIIDKAVEGPVKIISAALNEEVKLFSYLKGQEEPGSSVSTELQQYLYEPDVALMKSGAFDLIAQRYNLQKLHEQTQLYTSASLNPAFPGRIFQIDEVISMGDLKKQKELTGNVIVRSFPQKAEVLVKKYKIKPQHNNFLIFTNTKTSGYVVIKATILQHY